MKLFVIGVIASVTVPLSSFFWEEEPKTTATVYTVTHAKVDRSPEPTPTPTPTPTETEEIVVEEQVLVSSEPVIEQPETQDQRVVRLAQSQGISATVRVGQCNINGLDPSRIMGCYLPGTHYITITPNAVQYHDEFVICIINHEWRHMWQDLNGMYQYTNGYISNTAQLEADAYAYSGCS